jgi:V8-like Glu-specific endopeptidase
MGVLTVFNIYTFSYLAFQKMRHFLACFGLTFFLSNLNAQYILDDGFAAKGNSLDFKSGKFGSAFLLVDSPNVYLVTANHMLFEEDTNTHRITTNLSGDSVFIGCYFRNIHSDRLNIFSIDLKGSAEAGLLAHDTLHDVAVVLIGRQVNQVMQYTKFVGEHPSKGITGNDIHELQYFANVRLGADIFIIGYPKSLGPGLQQYELNKPLLCRGIIAAKNEKQQTLILNASIYHGNSGGPVFAFSPQANNFQLIGIVTQLIPFESPIYQQGQQLKGVGVFNDSNYSVMIPVDFIVPLISQIRKN